MRGYYFIAVLLGFLSGVALAQNKSKAEQKFPGMVLEEGQTMADLGRGERVSQPAALALQALESDERVSVEAGDWKITC